MSETNSERQKWAAQDARGLVRRLVVGIGSQVATILIQVVRNLLVVPFFLSAHGVDGFADWAKLLAAANILAIAALGQFIYYSFHIRTAHAAREFAAMNRWIACSNGFHLYLNIIVVVSLALILSVISVAELFNLKYLEDHQAKWVLILLTFSMLGQSYRDTLRAVYTAYGDFTRSELIQSVANLLLGGLVIGLLLLRLPIWTVAVAYVAMAPIFVCLTALADFRQRYPAVRMAIAWRPPVLSRARGRSLAAHALPNMADSVLQYSPTVLLGLFGVASDLVVQFNLARTTLGILRARLVARLFAIEMTRQRVQEDWSGFRRLHWAGATSVGAFGGGLVGALLAVWPTFVPIWTTGKISADMTLFMLLAIDSAVVNCAEHGGSLLRFGGQIGVIARYSIAAALFVGVLGVPALAYGDVYGMVGVFIVANFLFVYLLPPFVLQRRMAEAHVRISLFLPAVIGLAVALPAYAATEAVLSVVMRSL